MTTPQIWGLVRYAFCTTNHTLSRVEVVGISVENKVKRPSAMGHVASVSHFRDLDEFVVEWPTKHKLDTKSTKGAALL